MKPAAKQDPTGKAQREKAREVLTTGLLSLFSIDELKTLLSDEKAWPNSEESQKAKNQIFSLFSETERQKLIQRSEVYDPKIEERAAAIVEIQKQFDIEFEKIRPRLIAELRAQGITDDAALQKALQKYQVEAMAALIIKYDKGELQLKKRSVQILGKTVTF